LLGVYHLSTLPGKLHCTESNIFFPVRCQSNFKTQSLPLLSLKAKFNLHGRKRALVYLVASLLHPGIDYAARASPPLDTHGGACISKVSSSSRRVSLTSSLGTSASLFNRLLSHALIVLRTSALPMHANVHIKDGEIDQINYCQYELCAQQLTSSCTSHHITSIIYFISVENFIACECNHYMYKLAFFSYHPQVL